MNMFFQIDTEREREGRIFSTRDQRSIPEPLIIQVRHLFKMHGFFTHPKLPAPTTLHPPSTPMPSATHRPEASNQAKASNARVDPEDWHGRSWRWFLPRATTFSMGLTFRYYTRVQGKKNSENKEDYTCLLPKWLQWHWGLLWEVILGIYPNFATI